MKTYHTKNGKSTTPRSKFTFSESLLKKLVGTCLRGLRYTTKFKQDIIKPFQKSCKNLCFKIKAERGQMKIFNENYVESHLIFPLTKCFEYIINKCMVEDENR